MIKLVIPLALGVLIIVLFIFFKKALVVFGGILGAMLFNALIVFCVYKFLSRNKSKVPSGYNARSWIKKSKLR